MRYQMDFRIDANGVTPIPAPTSRIVSYCDESDVQFLLARAERRVTTNI